MAPESIVLGVALLGIVGVTVAWPWLRPMRRRRARSAANPRQEYQALVATIRDLDFDYRAGLVAEEDYRPLRDHLLLRAATLLQELDRHSGRQADLEARIEAMVSAVRARRARTAGAHPGTAVACPQCGRLAQPGDRFCASCGRSLTEEVTITS
ncbi:MAG: zinc ribbon domain-containing protein [Chloroflexi bacterium]|nr:zinc ribbon domain-containing protein [Chloroflexota bacterium]